MPIANSITKSAADIYDIRNFDNGQETCDNCDQTLYYPSIYATNPTEIGRLAAQQMIPNFLNNTNSLANNLANNVNKTLDNNCHIESNADSTSNLVTSNICNSLGAILNTNVQSNCMHHLSSDKDHYDFVDANQFCTNKNCTLTSVLNKNEQLNCQLSKLNVTANNLQQSTGCMIGIENRNSSHVYDIPHKQQQALNELNKLKQMSTFRNVEQF